MTSDYIRDEAGRIIAPPQRFADERPMGPWDSMNRRVVVKHRICAWCPTFNAMDPRNAYASHTMCPTCAERMNKEIDDGL
jgi:hypothetical protein